MGSRVCRVEAHQLYLRGACVPVLPLLRSADCYALAISRKTFRTTKSFVIIFSSSFAGNSTKRKKKNIHHQLIYFMDFFQVKKLANELNRFVRGSFKLFKFESGIGFKRL